MKTSKYPNVRSIKDDIATLKRERTIEAALELFYELGYEATTLDMIAERLGVSKPFIYSYFSSKADLLAEISGTSISLALQTLHDTLKLDLPYDQKLEEVAVRFVSAVLSTQKFIAIFTREEKNLRGDDLKAINHNRRMFDSKLTEFLRQGTEQGVFQVSEPHLTSMLIGGMVSSVYAWYKPEGRFSERQIAEIISENIVRMILQPKSVSAV